MYKKILIFIICWNSWSYAQNAPSENFDLNHWKLQIPGPVEVKNLNNYKSNYFSMAPDSSVCFHLNAAEKGTTKNAHFVRSELRHLENWDTNGSHNLKAKIKISCNLTEYEVTVMQIHGITSTGENAPPLLRIALKNGNLYAFLKTDNEGKTGDKHLLASNLYNQFFTAEILFEHNIIIIKVNNQTVFNKNIDYWTYDNYFKLGCYPQMTKGVFEIFIKDILVN
jgi:hypothetical protein